MNIRAVVVALLTTFLLGLSACNLTPASTVEPGDGPATTTVGEKPTGGPNQQGSKTPEEPTKHVATFNQKYTYEDGVQAEVIRIRHGKVKRADAQYVKGAKAGDDFVVVTIRVRNGSKEQLSVYSSATLTYGPDGEEADKPYLASQKQDEGMNGKILPGRAKVSTETFLIPKKFQKDPVLEFLFDFVHEAAIFSGPMK